MATPNQTNQPNKEQNTPSTPTTPSAQSAQSAQGERQQQVPTSRESTRGGTPARSRPASSGLSPWGAYGGGPFALMQQLQGEMDRLFEDFGFGRSLLSPASSA